MAGHILLEYQPQRGLFARVQCVHACMRKCVYMLSECIFEDKSKLLCSEALLKEIEIDPQDMKVGYS